MPKPPAASDAALRHRLQSAGLRPTPKRMELGRLVLTGPPRHFSAEQLWRQARDAGIVVSLATVYNTLNGFVEAGLLRLVDLPTAHGVFDSNTAPHHHLVDPSDGTILDLDAALVQVQIDPRALPPGMSVQAIDIVVRIHPT